MSVLILAEDIDATADGMVRALSERGTSVHRVNTAWFPTELGVSVELRGERWSGRMPTPRHVIELDEITAVWYRTPRAYGFPNGLTQAERAHANSEAKFGLGGVLISLPVLWVNHPNRLASASYKPCQLVTAAQCGLAVPGTLITNEQAPVQAFSARGRTVAKVLGSNTIVEHGVRKFTFTRLVGHADLADLRGIEQTTHLFQRWVPKLYDARMIVIGEHMTAVAIHAESPDGYVDWRADYDHLSYELTEVPVAVAEGVHRLMESMGLLYGALDFVVQPDGMWTFLEINAGGQYGWLVATRGRVWRVNSRNGGRLCRMRSSRSVFEIGPRLGVRRQVLPVGVRSSGRSLRGPCSVRGSNRARGKPDG